MAIATSYTTGTATVAAGGTVVTGQGTTWATSGILPGDRFWAAGYAVRVASVDSNTQLTLAYGWPGAARAAAAYEIVYTPDAARVLGTTRDLLDRFANGNLSSIGALDSAADRLPYFSAPGVAALATLTATGRGLIASADKPAARTYLGLGALAVQNVAPVANGGTGAASPAKARWNLGFRPNIPKRNRLTGAAWLTSPGAPDLSWASMCWAPELGLFVAVGATGTGNRVMTSPDGIVWTARASAADNNWLSVCWSPVLRLLVAVAYTGTGNRVMTSPDGINWTARASAADSTWGAVAWSPELHLFVAVSDDWGGHAVMTSPDGINWSLRPTPAGGWVSLCWSPELGLFCAGMWGYGNVMTSPDGINWTLRGGAGADLGWVSMCWAAEIGLFVSTADTYGTGKRVRTSPDGINWTSQTSADDARGWMALCWAAEIGLLVAVGAFGTGNRVMTSPDGIVWTARASAADIAWRGVAWSPELGLCAAIANTGSGNRVMTSVSAHAITYRS